MKFDKNLLIFKPSFLPEFSITVNPKQRAANDGKVGCTSQVLVFVS